MPKISKKKQDPYSTIVFDTPEALLINKARLEHLNNICLDVQKKTVIDVGAGIGRLAQFFIKKGCRVTCIEGRAENVTELKFRYPKLIGQRADVQKDDLSKFGHFDIVFCYGLIYHLSDPGFALKNISRICDDLLILETCITDQEGQFFNTVEDSPAANQALNGQGCRPTPGFIITSLRGYGFSNVYVPKKAPDHPDFQFKYQNDGSMLKNGRLIRQIFIASRPQLANHNLIPVVDGHELFYQDRLSKLPLVVIRLLAQLIFRPEKLASGEVTALGALEKNLTGYRKFLKRLWDLMVLKADQPVRLILNWHKNLKLQIFTNSETAKSVFIEGVFERSTFYFLSRFLKPGMVFIDVGANFGLYTLFASKKVGGKGFVYAFEPSLREFTRLKENLKLNRLRNVKAYRQALANCRAKAALKVAVYPYDGHNSLGSFGYQTTKIDHQEIVITNTLDQIMARVKLKKIDMIKIDVEGAEMSVLEGAKKTIQALRPSLIIELSDRTLIKQSAGSGMVWEFLKSLSYTIYSFNQKNGKLQKASRKKYYDGENIIALPQEEDLDKLTQ